MKGDASGDRALPQPLTQPDSMEGCSDARFEDWYRDHYERLRALCARILSDASAAEDMAQEALLRAWLGRERMREQDVGAWLSVVARNLCISHMRRSWRAVPHEVLPETADVDADPARVAELSETRRSVRRALSQVGDRHRRLLVRREVGGADYAELGEELGLTASGARAVLFRARRSLKDRLVAVGEGLGAWIVGVRVRATAFSRRFRATIGPVEGSAGAPLQAGIQLALAAGMALAGIAGGPASTNGIARSSRVSPPTVSVLSVSFAGPPAARHGVAPDQRSDEARPGAGKVLPPPPPAAPVKPKWSVDPSPGGDTVLCLKAEGIPTYCVGNYFAEEGHSIIWDDTINPRVAMVCEALAVCQYGEEP